MKSVLGKYAGFVATAALAAACGSVWAQSIPVPASSADSGRRAVVAVTQPNMSNYATKTEVNNAYNYAASAYSKAAAVEGNIHQGQGWARYFIGQQITTNIQGLPWHAYVDGNGYVSIHSPFHGWRGAGYTYLDNPVSADWGSVAATAYPTGADYYGRPTGWALVGGNTFDH